MKVIKENDLTKIVAEDKHYFANKELTEVYGTIIYLGKYSKETDFVEIDEATKLKIEKEQERLNRLELEKLRK